MAAQLAEQHGIINPFTAIIERLERIESAIADFSRQQSQPTPQVKFLSAREVQELLRISAPTRIALAKSGRLIPKRIGRRLLYSPEDVQIALSSYQKWARL